MLEILIGFISGILTDLGMGGGAILIALLGTFTNLDHHLIQGINLIFFIPTSIAAIIMHIKRKNIDYKNSIIVIIFGIIGTIIGSYSSFVINSQKLKKYFGIFLILISILELFTFIKEYISTKNKNNIIKGG